MKNIIVLISILLIFIGIVFSYTRDRVTYANRLRAINAIYRYNCKALHDGYPEKLIDYDEVMEPYEATWMRLWDWGCGHIVDKSTYELIELYIMEDYCNDL